MEEENKNIETQPASEIPVEPIPAEPAPVEPAPVEPAPVEPVSEPPVPESPVLNPTPMEPVAGEEAPKKKSKLPIILLLIVLLAACGFAVWFFVLGGNGAKKENKEEPKQEEKKEEEQKPAANDVVDLTEADIKGYEELMRAMLALRDHEPKSSLAVTDLDNQQILRFGISSEFYEKGGFTAQELDDNIKKKLGNVEYTKETINCAICGSPDYTYSSETDEYKLNTEHPGHGGGSSFDYGLYFIEAKQDNNSMTISYKIIYGEAMDDLGHASTNLYPTAKDSVDNTNGFYTPEAEKYYSPSSIDANELEELKGKTPTTTFYFNKDASGNYVFNKVETK